MSQQGSLSLTDYLIELSHDYAKMLEFWAKQPFERAQDPRLTPDAADALRSGELTRIQQQVQAENEDTGFAASSNPAVTFLYVMRPIN